MWKSLASNVLTLFVVALAASGALLGWGKAQYTAPGPLTSAKYFEVSRGASLRKVSQRLEESGAISSASIFRIGVGYEEKASKLKFGSYEIPAEASMAEIIDILTVGGPSTFRFMATYVIRNNGAETRFRERIPGTGEEIVMAEFKSGEPVPEAYTEAVESGTPIVYRLAIAEGLSSWQILEGLKTAEFLSGDVEDIPPEGSLAPDTFEVSRGTELAEVIARMTKAQARILAEAWEARDPDVPLETPEQALILASIVEKETGVAEERKQVASVFVNRLRRGMKMQTDPTVIYGITLGKSNGLGRGLRRSELRRATPYNTYVIPGLPPTPIANPGKDAIIAALNPDETPYVFFVADGTGGHAFAETIAEHNANVAKWRKIEAERGANQ